MKAIKSENTPKKTIKDILFVFIQGTIIILFFLAPEIHYFIFSKAERLLGYLLSTVGVLLIIWACINLRKSISAFPTPTQKAELITSGIFKYIRHPIYSGLIFFLLGLAISFGGLLKLIIVFIAILFFYLKTTYEEKQLSKRFSKYESYKKKTGRFLPIIIV